MINATTTNRRNQMDEDTTFTWGEIQLALAGRGMDEPTRLSVLQMLSETRKHDNARRLSELVQEIKYAPIRN